MFILPSEAKALLELFWYQAKPIDRIGQVTSMVLLRSESPSGKCTKLYTVAASNNGDHLMISPYYCLFAPYIYGFYFCAHPVHGESHIQHNVNWEVATTFLPFYSELHRLHILFMKAASGMTLTSSWSQHHFVAFGKSKRQMRKASHYGSKQQQRLSPDEITHCLFTPHTSRPIFCYYSRTSLSWWIAHSTQRQPRGCNNAWISAWSLSHGLALNLNQKSQLEISTRNLNPKSQPETSTQNLSTETKPKT